MRDKPFHLKGVEKRMFILLLVLLFSACESFWEPRSVVTNLPGHEPVLVINSFISPDSVFEVSVTKSRPFLAAPESPFVTDATVTILESGVPVAHLGHIEDGLYRDLEHRPAIGASYELRVSAPGFESVQASATVPVPIPLDSVVVSPDTGDLRTTNLTIYFQDPPGEDNYYQLVLLAPELIIDTGAETADSLLVTMSFVSSDAVLHEPDDFEEESYFWNDAFFDDALFDGKLYDLDVRFFKFYDVSEVFVVLLSTSASYYNFRKSVEQQGATEDNPFAEPVPIFTNIEGGLGVFAAYSSFTYLLR